MTKKNLIAVLLYLVAMVAPVGAMLARFGIDTNVDLTGSKVAITQLLCISGSMLAGFSLALVASRLLASENYSLQKIVTVFLSNSGPKPAR